MRLLLTGLLCCGFVLAQLEPPPTGWTQRQIYEDVIEHHGTRGAPGSTDVDKPEFALILLEYARLLFSEGERDEAVFWHYAGQLRYRLYAARVPERGGELFGQFPRAWEAFEELMASGRDINLYAFCDPEQLAVTIGDVLAWHETAPSVPLTPEDRPKAVTEETFELASADVLRGLLELQSYATSSVDEIKQQRQANGVDEAAVCGV